MSEMTSIPTLEKDQSFNCYVARPAGEPKAAIVVIQEIFGVNPGIRAKCDVWADQGYIAYAPDLFWQIEPGIELDPDIPEEMNRALGLFGQFDQDAGVRDIEATIHAARRELGNQAKVGCVGYCLGGRLAFMTAARTDISCSVAYYGVGLDNLLRESHAIAHPVMLHIAGTDHFVPPEQQKAVHEGLDAHPKVTIYDYPGLDHGFAAAMGQRRHEEGAQLADKRTAEFFAQHLE
ncbi:dienelactone hydrolase family protein [Rhizorhapis suberifaciens]|uniref:Carboxymethylenebutenolidase n=1 Tax=Rhizorhapis suberifaciens TaxID=13656 RepID=A0A840HRM9_9SPHN|nr:dienelactone hydrolase family protein [Rhizorhapis suberifaciens]MBB4640792.1 carboxymethylenebutenolidase [Rhizorhapis suberifaciens]